MMGCSKPPMTTPIIQQPFAEGVFEKATAYPPFPRSATDSGPNRTIASTMKSQMEAQNVCHIIIIHLE